MTAARLTLAHVARPLTTSMRVSLQQLADRGVLVTMGPGVSCGRTVARTYAAGNTLPCRAVLRLYGFVYAPRSRRWSATGPLDLDTLLPALIAEHDAHELESQCSHESTRTHSRELVAAIRRLPAPSPVPDVERLTAQVSEMVAREEQSKLPTRRPARKVAL